MIKNRITQLIFTTAYCSVSVIAFMASFGLFQAKFESNFYVYFTNISNYFCTAIMFTEFFQVSKFAYKNQNGFITACPTLKFMGVIMILITFSVFNILLIKYRTLEQNLAVSSILSHTILPIMFILDWFLFYERKKLRWFTPLISLLIPFFYVIFIYVRAWIFGNKVDLLYPYFFLDLNYLGPNGVLMWIGILLVVFVTIGYILYFIDHHSKPLKKDPQTQIINN